MKENEMVFGIRAVIEAIQADKEVDKILVKRDLQGDLSKELFEVLRGREIPVQRVPAERLDRLTRKNHQGVIAFMSAVTYQSLEDIIPFVYEQGKDPFIVLLDGVTDVRRYCPYLRVCGSRCDCDSGKRKRFGKRRRDQDLCRRLACIAGL